MTLNLGKLGSPTPGVVKVAEPAASSPTHVAPQAITTESTVGEPELVMYSSHPLATFSIGTRWRFEKSILKVSPEEAEKIDAFLLKADSRTKQLVKKVDVKLAEARIREWTKAQATKSIGSEVGHEGTMVTQVGTEAIDKPQE